MLLAEILLDRVAHRLRFGDCLGLALDPKPRLALRRIANVPHASSQHGSGQYAFPTGRHREDGDAMSGDSKIPSSERVNSFLGVVFMRREQAPPGPRNIGAERAPHALRARLAGAAAGGCGDPARAMWAAIGS